MATPLEQLRERYLGQTLIEVTDSVCQQDPAVIDETIEQLRTQTAGVHERAEISLENWVSRLADGPRKEETATVALSQFITNTTYYIGAVSDGTRVDLWKLTLYRAAQRRYRGQVLVMRKKWQAGVSVVAWIALVAGIGLLDTNEVAAWATWILAGCLFAVASRISRLTTMPRIPQLGGRSAVIASGLGLISVSVVAYLWFYPPVAGRWVTDDSQFRFTLETRGNSISGQGVFMRDGRIFPVEVEGTRAGRSLAILIKVPGTEALPTPLDGYVTGWRTMELKSGNNPAFHFTRYSYQD